MKLKIHCCFGKATGKIVSVRSADREENSVFAPLQLREMHKTGQGGVLEAEAQVCLLSGE